MTEEPRPAELSRRIDALDARVADGFRELAMRLDRMPTNDILLAYLATRDQEMKANGEDIKDLAGIMANERAERMQADEREKAARERAIAEERRTREKELEAERTARKEAEDRADRDRKWNRTFALGIAGSFIGLAGMLISNGVFG